MKYVDMGPLEKDIITALFERGKRTNVELVEDVNLYVDANRSLERRSLTTIATTTNRLYEKGLLSREIKKGRGLGKYIYKIKNKNIEEKFAEGYVEEFLKMFGNEGIASLREELKNIEDEFI